MSNSYESAEPPAKNPPESELQAPRLQLVSPARPLFNDPIEIYLANLAPSGARTMRSKLAKAAALFGISLRDFGLTHLCYQSVVTVRSVLQQAQAPQTINTTLAALKGAAKEAWALGLITAEEFNRIKSVANVRGSRVPPGRALTDEELALLIGACEADQSPAGVRDAAIIGLLFHAGLRRSECSTLRLMDYSPQSRALLVRGKGNKETLAPLEDPCVVRALNDWIKLRGREPGPLFCRVNKAGRIVIDKKHLSEQAIYDVIRSRGIQAGIGELSPHDARRTLATNLLEAGGRIDSVQALMRHASISTTSLYARTRERAKRQTAGMLPLPYKGRRIVQPAELAPEQLTLRIDTE